LLIVIKLFYDLAIALWLYVCRLGALEAMAIELAQQTADRVLVVFIVLFLPRRSVTVFFL